MSGGPLSDAPYDCPCGCGGTVVPSRGNVGPPIYLAPPESVRRWSHDRLADAPPSPEPGESAWDAAVEEAAKIVEPERECPCERCEMRRKLAKKVRALKVGDLAR